jgi:hypothetical protein
MQNTIKLVLVAAMLGGCAPTLAESSAISANAPEPGELGYDASAYQRSEQSCRKLSNWEKGLRYTTVGASAMAGGTGIGSLPIDDREVQGGMLVTAAGFGVVGVVSEAVRAELSADYIEECQ